jgi:hypothetical protein
VIGFFGASNFRRLPVSSSAYLLFLFFVIVAYLFAWIAFELIDSKHFLLYRRLLG